MKTLLLTLALALAAGATAGPIEGAFGWKFGEKLDTTGMDADATGRTWHALKAPETTPAWKHWWITCDKEGKTTEIQAVAVLPTSQEMIELGIQCMNELQKRHGDVQRKRSAYSRAWDDVSLACTLDFRSVLVRVTPVSVPVGYGLSVTFEAVQEIKDSELPVLPTLGGH